MSGWRETCPDRGEPVRASDDLRRDGSAPHRVRGVAPANRSGAAETRQVDPHRKTDVSICPAEFPGSGAGPAGRREGKPARPMAVARRKGAVPRMNPECARPDATAPGRTRAAVADLTACRIARAITQRTRYRYVRPRVHGPEITLCSARAYRIESPCCSRRVDARGGSIDVALLEWTDAGVWRLSRCNHPAGVWVYFAESERLDDLLDEICLDRERMFWP